LLLSLISKSQFDRQQLEKQTTLQGCLDQLSHEPQKATISELYLIYNHLKNMPFVEISPELRRIILLSETIAKASSEDIAAFAAQPLAYALHLSAPKGYSWNGKDELLNWIERKLLDDSTFPKSSFLWLAIELQRLDPTDRWFELANKLFSSRSLLFDLNGEHLPAVVFLQLISSLASSFSPSSLPDNYNAFVVSTLSFVKKVQTILVGSPSLSRFQSYASRALSSLCFKKMNRIYCAPDILGFAEAVFLQNSTVERQRKVAGKYAVLWSLRCLDATTFNPSRILKERIEKMVGQGHFLQTLFLSASPSLEHLLKPPYLVPGTAIKVMRALGDGNDAAFKIMFQQGGKMLVTTLLWFTSHVPSWSNPLTAKSQLKTLYYWFAKLRHLGSNSDYCSMFGLKEDCSVFKVSHLIERIKLLGRSESDTLLDYDNLRSRLAEMGFIDSIATVLASCISVVFPFNIEWNVAQRIICSLVQNCKNSSQPPRYQFDTGVRATNNDLFNDHLYFFLEADIDPLRAINHLPSTQLWNLSPVFSLYSFLEHNLRRLNQHRGSLNAAGWNVSTSYKLQLLNNGGNPMELSREHLRIVLFKYFNTIRPNLLEKDDEDLGDRIDTIVELSKLGLKLDTCLQLVAKRRSIPDPVRVFIATMEEPLTNAFSKEALDYTNEFDLAEHFYGSLPLDRSGCLYLARTALGKFPSQSPLCWLLRRASWLDSWETFCKADTPIRVPYTRTITESGRLVELSCYHDMKPFNGDEERLLLAVDRVFPSIEGRERWYHSCTPDQALDIALHGMNGEECVSVHDFGLESAFYLGDCLRCAMDFIDGENIILIYDIPSTSLQPQEAESIVFLQANLDWSILIRCSRLPQRLLRRKTRSV
jgi:hypothetical protein